MSNIPDQLVLGENLDRRRKLPRSEHARIRQLYASGKHSQRNLAGMFGVSRRLITFILVPDRERVQKERVKKEKRWLKYYDRETHTENIKNLRDYKRKVFGIGKFKHSTMVPEKVKELIKQNQLIHKTAVANRDKI